MLKKSTFDRRFSKCNSLRVYQLNSCRKLLQPVILFAQLSHLPVNDISRSYIQCKAVSLSVYNTTSDVQVWYRHPSADVSRAAICTGVRMQRLREPDAIVSAPKALHKVKGVCAMLKVSIALHPDPLSPPVL